MNALARLGFLSLTLVLATPLARSADGLAAPKSDTLWPGLRARITVQTAAISPLAWSGLSYPGASERGVKGGAVLGDYYFAQPSFGSFRATSGLVVGAYGGAPLLSSGEGGRLGLAVNRGAGLSAYASGSSEALTASPYLGLGFSSQRGAGGLSLSADLGLVADPATLPGGLGRALFGVQGADGARRELRLSPLLQLGVRYAF
jgi:hypothetical protein